MKINKASWHYRYMRYMDKYAVADMEHDGVTSCQYIRALIYWIIAGFFRAAVLVFISVAALTIFVIDPIIYLINGASPLGGVGGLGVLIGVALILIFGVYAWCESTDFFDKFKPSGDNVFVQFIKDKKDRTCTIVKFVEDEEQK